MTKLTTHREFWGSKVGFMFAAMGSAVGLANIIRFPYLVGENGGAAFIFLYIICLAVLGLPILVSELLVGRATHLNPYGAFEKIGGNKYWRSAGGFVILTGFLVSAFYSVIAGWVLGYLAESINGNLASIENTEESVRFFYQRISIPLWTVGMQFCFLALSVLILNSGVRAGLERSSKFLMPLLIVLLLYLAMTGLDRPNAHLGLEFLFRIDWHEVTPNAFLLALGQAFFTLSLGQGTMVTYGSYLHRKVNIMSVSIPVVVADTLIAILAAVAVFTIVFSVDMQPDAGMGLMFNTLPIVFNNLPNGYLLAAAFFLLVSLAALTSQISAMEPAIAYLMDERKWSRKKSVFAVGLGAFVVGVPCALSYKILNWFDFFTTGIMIPIGGLLIALLVGWRWGIDKALTQLYYGLDRKTANVHAVRLYLNICVKYIAPVAIVVIAFHVLFT